MKIAYRVALIGAALPFVITSAIANETYKFDQAHSTIGFKVRHFLGAAVGKFRQFDGTIELDRDHPENSSVTARIAARSIDTGIAKRDDHLRSSEFFDAAKFPEIRFKSRNVKKTGPQSGDITGDFTMHGVTRPITLHVKLLSPAAGDLKQSHWQVTTEPLKRRDFGLMFGTTAETVSGIGQEVTINIDVNAIRAQ
jgi:polyisoprenoid-binding protein YceI